MGVREVLDGLPEGHVEGQTFLPVKMSPELMDQWASRDLEGYRLIWDWGEPGPDGFYNPTVTVDYSDRLCLERPGRVVVDPLRSRGAAMKPPWDKPPPTTPVERKGSWADVLVCLVAVLAVMLVLAVRP